MLFKVYPVQTADTYIDIAIKKAKKRGAQLRGKTFRGENAARLKNIELAKLEIMKEDLAGKFDKILNSFPMTDELPAFYRELMYATLDFGMMKKSLGAVNWAKKKIIELYRMYRLKLQKSNNEHAISAYKKQYIGRMCSVVKQIKKELLILEQCRRVIKEYPVIKELPTVAIAGFPNVGKSTLLSRISTSKPEIQSYAFTTKSLNTGYIGKKGDELRIQLIDTPGTLNRPDKMNNTELQAYLAIKHLANLIVYVFDLTDEYPLQMQEKLLERLKEYKKPIIIYLSKTDILDKGKVKEFEKNHKVITDIEALKKKIIEETGISK